MSKLTYSEPANIEAMNIAGKINQAMWDNTITEQMIRDAIPALRAATGTPKFVLEGVLTKAAEQVTGRRSRH